jgi:hypothetical protein
MTDEDQDAFDDLLATVFSGHIGRFIEVKTPSGRRFRYELSRYPIRQGFTNKDALDLARKIYWDKYKNCEWDRKHPRVDVEKEIIAALQKSILNVVGTLRRVEARKPRGPSTRGVPS